MMIRRLLVMLLVLFTSLALAAEEADHADHEELRALLKGVEQAMTSADYDKLLPYFHDNLRVTVINQDKITKPGDLKPYFQDWIGAGKYVKSLKMSLTADDLTEFYGSGDSRFGIVRGDGHEEYDLTDGRHLDMHTRWTATVVKDKGKWKILALHIGTNFYKNNPILDAVQASTRLYAAGGAAVGFLVGALLVYLLRRKQS